MGCRSPHPTAGGGVSPHGTTGARRHARRVDAQRARHLQPSRAADGGRRCAVAAHPGAPRADQPRHRRGRALACRTLVHLRRQAHLHAGAAQGDHVLRRRAVHIGRRGVLVPRALRPRRGQRARLGRQGQRTAPAGHGHRRQHGAGDAARALCSRPRAARQRADLLAARARSPPRRAHLPRRLGPDDGAGNDGGAGTIRGRRARARSADHPGAQSSLLANRRRRRRPAVPRSHRDGDRVDPGRRGPATRSRQPGSDGPGGRAAGRLRRAASSRPAGHDHDDRRRRRRGSERALVQSGAASRPSHAGLSGEGRNSARRSRAPSTATRSSRPSTSARPFPCSVR